MTDWSSFVIFVAGEALAQQFDDWLNRAMTPHSVVRPPQAVSSDICQRQISPLRSAALHRTEAPVTHPLPRNIDDRLRALTEELQLAEALNVATASPATLALNQERLRGALADSLRLIQELRHHIADLENGT